MPQKRKKRRRRRGGLGRLLRPLSVVLAAVAVVAALTMFFKVDQVEVTGNGRYRAEEVIAASGVEQGDNLILLDRYGISQRLCRELPYINDVRINPKFPDTLLVEVTEAHASASIQGAGGWWLIDAGGEPGIKMLELVERRPGLPANSQPGGGKPGCWPDAGAARGEPHHLGAPVGAADGHGGARDVRPGGQLGSQRPGHPGAQL